MVSQNRLKLYIFKMQRFFCNIYPRPANYVLSCMTFILLVHTPSSNSQVVMFKRDIVHLLSTTNIENREKSEF